MNILQLCETFLLQKYFSNQYPFSKTPDIDLVIDCIHKGIHYNMAELQERAIKLLSRCMLETYERSPAFTNLPEDIRLRVFVLRIKGMEKVYFQGYTSNQRKDALNLHLETKYAPNGAPYALPEIWWFYLYLLISAGCESVLMSLWRKQYFRSPCLNLWNLNISLWNSNVKLFFGVERHLFEFQTFCFEIQINIYGGIFLPSTCQILLSTYWTNKSTCHIIMSTCQIIWFSKLCWYLVVKSTYCPFLSSTFLIN